MRDVHAIDPTAYDRVVVAFSGGKDSLATLLHVRELGVPADRIEAWHHLVDGRESDLFDWPVTEDYCRQVCGHLGVPIFFSWLEGGFEREMLRQQQRKAPTVWEQPDGTLGRSGGTRGKKNTRMRFPQISPDLNQRFCSAYLKIDVMAAGLRGQERFSRGRTLVVTGERAEESASRACYAGFETHRADRRDGKRVRRHIDHWRPIHKWSEGEVWAIIERWGLIAHPCYYAGWGRCSCATCIFGSPNQWRTLAEIAPARVDRLASLEDVIGWEVMRDGEVLFRGYRQDALAFQRDLDDPGSVKLRHMTLHRSKTIREMVQAGAVYEAALNGGRPSAVAALRSTYEGPIHVNPEDWRLPAGAFGESCGPT